MNKLSLARKLAALEAQQKRLDNIKTSIHVKFFTNGNIQIGEKLYNPEPTALKVSKDGSQVIALLGPVGCGKSFTNHVEMLRHVCSVTECKDGVFRSRNYLVRNTYDDLRRTTFKDWDEWMDELPKIRSTDKPIVRHYEFNFWREETDSVHKAHMEVEGVAIDLLKNIKKRFRSIQATAIQLNEASELDEGVFNEASLRTGRYPARDDRKESNVKVKKMFLDTNPPNEGHWFYYLFEIVQPKGFKLYHYPPALILQEDGSYVLNPEAENIAHLEDGYYLDGTAGKEKSYIEVMYMGKYGITRSGDLVYESYNDDLHAVDNIEFTPGYPVYIGLDFGLTPCILFEQFINGTRYSIFEITTERSQLDELLKNEGMPFINTVLKGFELIIGADPSGMIKPQSEGRHCFEILESHGLRCGKQLSNALLPRLSAVKHFFCVLINGNPAYQVSKKGCPILREGYLNKYYYKDVSDKCDADKKPFKNHPHSDIQDAGQYNALNMIGEQQISVAPYKEEPYKDIGGW